MQGWAHTLLPVAEAVARALTARAGLRARGRAMVEAQDARHLEATVLQQPKVGEPGPSVESLGLAVLGQIEEVLAGQYGAVDRGALLQGKYPDRSLHCLPSEPEGVRVAAQVLADARDEGIRAERRPALVVVELDVLGEELAGRRVVTEEAFEWIERRSGLP